MSRHSSLKKYTSHFIWKGSKGLRMVLSVRGELETEQNCNILTSNSSGYSSISFPFSWAAQPGAWRAQPQLGHGSHSSFFSPTDLNFLSPGLYNNLMPTYFLWASQFTLNSTLQLSRLSPDLFDWMHLLFTRVHFFFWQLGQCQYVTTQDRVLWMGQVEVWHLNCAEKYAKLNC